MIVEIKDSVSLIDARQQVLTNARLVFQFSHRTPQSKKVMDDFFATKSVATDTIFRGLFIQLGSVFELFVRRSVEMVVETHAKIAAVYDDLPEKIRSRNLMYSGKALATIHEGISGRRISYDDVSRKLGTCHKGNRHFELNTKCFTLFVGNCTSSRVSELMGSVDVRGEFWLEMGKRKELRDHLGSRETKETQKITTDKLDEYILRRNGIVRRGEYFKTITANDIISYSEFFLAVTKAISVYLKTTMPARRHS